MSAQLLYALLDVADRDTPYQDGGTLAMFARATKESSLQRMYIENLLSRLVLELYYNYFHFTIIYGFLRYPILELLLSGTANLDHLSLFHPSSHIAPLAYP